MFSTSGDTDGLWAGKRRHAVEHACVNRNLGRRFCRDKDDKAIRSRCHKKCLHCRRVKLLGGSLADAIEFLLRAHRDKAAAKRYFEKAIAQNGEPEMGTIDRNDAVLAALEAMNAERETPINIHQSKYLNNRIEQDHCVIKRRTRPMLGFKKFRCTCILLGGIEVMHMIAKGQMENGRITCLIYGPVEIFPSTVDLDIRLVNEQVPADRALAMPERFFKNRQQLDSPSGHGRMIDIDGMLSHHLFQILQTQSIGYIPTHVRITSSG